MGSRSSILSLIVTGALAAAVAVTSQATGAGPAGDSPAAGAGHAPEANTRWVNTWVSMPQLTEPGNLPPPPFTGDDLVLADSTLRQTVRLTIGGRSCGCGSPTRSAARRCRSRRSPSRSRPVGGRGSARSSPARPGP